LSCSLRQARLVLLKKRPTTYTFEIVSNVVITAPL